MRRFLLIGHAAAVLASLGGAALAQGADPDAPSPPPPPVAVDAPPGPHHQRIEFGAIDTDGDGVLSRAELVGRAQGRLAQFDLNDDGWLDRDELVAANPPPPGRLMAVFAESNAGMEADRLLAFMEIDDGGRVEIVALAERHANEMLARADVNRDGAIAQSEAARPDRPRPDHRGARGPKDGPDNGFGPGPGRPFRHG